MAKKRYYQRKDGLFETIRTINGKRVAFRGKTCKEVDQKILAYHEKAENGRTVKEVLDSWLEYKESRVSEATYTSYIIHVNRLRDELGKMYVKEVRPIHCQRVLAKMEQQGYKSGTVRLQKTVIIQVFRFAVLNGDIDVSPAAEIELPRGLDRNKREALTAEQIQTVTNCRSGEWWLMGLAFLWTGCRRGELMALRYEDIDRKAGTITINKKMQYLHGKPSVENHTKTEAGMRTIPLFSPLADALPRDRIGLIFHNGNGEPLQAYQIVKAWNQYKTDAGLPEHITPHYFRHTFATICYNAGADIKGTAAIMGHASDRITAELYTHLSQEKQQEAARKIEEYAMHKVVSV